MTTTSSATSARSWKALDAPDGVKLAVAKELDRFERMSAQSPEHAWVRTWLDRIFELPWGQRSDDTLDLAAARLVLDADHYGLTDVKDRIVEFLATRKLRHDRGIDDRANDTGGRRARGEGAIITLVGPPGVGKTSLGESIARAMGREFVRVALGGVRDEAEIRGHRRTYVGSQPGRLVRALQEAGTMNPVILLDEVDKLAAGGWSGDPTAALLEVLDPAQNHTFRDHYLEVDLDLSEVVFIATANVADTIPAPLLDRMDLVRLDGYTDDEKVFIANRYLLPRQIERAGLLPDEVVVDDAAITAVIRGYTREAGVRSLERELGRLVRKVTADVATGADTPIVIEPADLKDRLGRAKITDDIPERTNTPGVATGLAVTGAGGDVLFIETTAFPTGPDIEPGLTLTGSTRRRDEGVGPDRAELRALARRGARPRRRRAAPSLPRARPGRGGAQGRSLGRHHHHDRARVAPVRSTGQVDARDDRRDHPAGSGAADRRREAEGAGGAPARPDRGHPPEAERTRPRRRARERAQRDDVPSRRHLRRRGGGGLRRCLDGLIEPHDDTTASDRGHRVRDGPR